MTHSYTISGMTCDGCSTKVQKLLSAVKGVESVDINSERNKADVLMHHHIATKTLQDALKNYQNII